MHQDVRTVELFWQKVPFFGSRIEEFAARNWYIVILVPYALLTMWGVWLDRYESIPHTFQTVTTLLRDPFIATLGAALLLSAIAFILWQSAMRQTFSMAVESGIIANDPASVQDFLAASSKFEAQMRSPRRFIAITAAIVATLIGNRDVIAFIPDMVRTWPLPLSFFRLAALASFFVFSYAVGAVAWSLVSAARWIATLSHNPTLRIQPGHSEGCCGLEGIGNCCLQSAVPLVIGMVLCLVWSNSYRLPGFRDYGEDWLAIIVPFSYAMMLILFVLACALVFLPVRGLHRRLQAYKRAQEQEFTAALETEVANIRKALAAGDDGRLKVVSDRLRLVQTLDPAVLKLTTWPFDRASLIKYGFAPLASLAASFGKEALKSLLQ